jgi:hypothetical protein
VDKYLKLSFEYVTLSFRYRYYVNNIAQYDFLGGVRWERGRQDGRVFGCQKSKKL